MTCMLGLLMVMGSLHSFLEGVVEKVRGEQEISKFGRRIQHKHKCKTLEVFLSDYESFMQDNDKRFNL